MENAIASVNGVAIRLTVERWHHICAGHPEMRTMYNQVVETVSAPDYVQMGDAGELLAVRLYPTTPLTSKWLIGVYREVNDDDGFILTPYLTSRPSAARKTIWKR